MLYLVWYRASGTSNCAWESSLGRFLPDKQSSTYWRSPKTVLLKRTCPSAYMPCLPALPAICKISCGKRILRQIPSNLAMSINTIRRMGRFKPIPIASVATSTSLSRFKNIFACCFLVEYGNAPYIMLTVYPCFFKFPAREIASLLEKTTNASPLSTSVEILNARGTNTSGVVRSCWMIS